MARLFVILARNGSDAVIFRRGPSKQVLLIKWDRKKDTFEIGQWLKGRIYERRCDLSPSGKLLVYLGAGWKGPILSWTAISKPPYLTALALWRSLGAWGGGGLFDGELTLSLNHDFLHRQLTEGTLPKGMKVHPLGDHAGGGEDDPIYHLRLVRDGWNLVQAGKHSGYQRDSSPRWRFSEPQIYEKRFTRGKSTQSLRMLLHGISERGGGWYVLEYEVLNSRGELLLRLPRIDWADWDSNGDLLFAERGKLFRLAWSKDHEDGREAARELADFTSLTFAAKETPQKARVW